jgi:hypothetical protein
METLKPKWTPVDPLSPLDLAEGESVRVEGWAVRLMWGYGSRGIFTLTNARLIYRARIQKFGNLERRHREVPLAAVESVEAREPALIESLLLAILGHEGKAMKVSMTARQGALRDCFCSPALAEAIVRARAPVAAGAT